MGRIFTMAMTVADINAIGTNRALVTENGVYCHYPPEYGKLLYHPYPVDQTAAEPVTRDLFDHYPDHPLPYARAYSKEAMRQARVWGRALSLLEMGYTFERSFCYDTFQIIKAGRITPSYEVCPHTWSCSCPDWQAYRNYCKHTLAVYAWVEACKRNPEANKLVISCIPEIAIKRHRFIARFVRRVAADLFKQA